MIMSKKEMIEEGLQELNDIINFKNIVDDFYHFRLHKLNDNDYEFILELIDEAYAKKRGAWWDKEVADEL